MGGRPFLINVRSSPCPCTINTRHMRTKATFHSFIQPGLYLNAIWKSHGLQFLQIAAKSLNRRLSIPGGHCANSKSLIPSPTSRFRLVWHHNSWAMSCWTWDYLRLSPTRLSFRRMKNPVSVRGIPTTKPFDCLLVLDMAMPTLVCGYPPNNIQSVQPEGSPTTALPPTICVLPPGSSSHNAHPSTFPVRSRVSLAPDQGLLHILLLQRSPGPMTQDGSLALQTAASISGLRFQISLKLQPRLLRRPCRWDKLASHPTSGHPHPGVTSVLSMVSNPI
jgi:hypothetical protein